MVYRKKKGLKKRPYKKRRVMSRVPRKLTSGIEMCKMVKLTYASQIRIDPQTGGIPRVHVYRANSLFDPDFTGIGHQPMYYDQYSLLYQNYKVYGSKITITGANDYSDSNNTMGNLIICNVTNDPAGGSSYTEAIERKNARYGSCQEKRNMFLTQTYSAKKFHCIKDVKDSVELQGLTGNTGTGTNPSQEAFFTVGAHPLYAGQNSYPACLNVRIEYVAMFFNLKDITGS